MKLLKIGTSRRKGLDKENVSKHGRKSDKIKLMFKDSDFDVLADAMENVEGGSTAEQITTAGDTLNTASINVSAAILLQYQQYKDKTKVKARWWSLNLLQRAAEQEANDVALIEQMEDIQARIDAD
ncbi:hypothetical protein Tco_0329564, partial [Tanacetum coccineum]